MLYSSIYNKSILAFQVEAIVLHCLKLPFCYFSDYMWIPVLVLWSEELLHWSFFLLLVVYMLQVLEVILWTERSNNLRELYPNYLLRWEGHLFDYLKFLEFNLETRMYAGIANLLTDPYIYIYIYIYLNGIIQKIEWSM